MSTQSVKVHRIRSPKFGIKLTANYAMKNCPCTNFIFMLPSTIAVQVFQISYVTALTKSHNDKTDDIYWMWSQKID